MKYWYEKQLRMLQTVLREPDLRGYDAEAVVDYLKRTESNSIIINAGGIIDFFPIEEELGRRNRFMEGEDILESLIETCHRSGIAVMVRVDFRGVEKERYEMRPDWFAQDEKGNPRTGWNGRIYKPCYNGIYANDHAVHYIKTMMSRYDVDGIWENSVGFGDGPCYCRTCREKYRRDTGKEIPEGGDYASGVYEEYRSWKASCAHAHLKRMRDAVKSFGEEKAYCAEVFGMFHASNALRTGIDLYDAKEMFDFLVSPAFLDGCAQPGKKYDDLTYASSSMRFLKSLDPGRQTVLLYGDNGTRWRYVKAPSQETRIWLWEAASVGAGYWNCMFNGHHPDDTHDRRNAYLETDMYRYLKEHEEELDGQAPAADVGIYYSKASRDMFGDDEESADEYGVFIKGTERMLNQNHVQYRFVPDLDFCPWSLEGLKVLILPNAACISDKHAQTIINFVKNGGSLIASYQTSLYDEKGRRRADFALKDVFGCSFSGIIKDTQIDCYQKIRTPHALLNRLAAGRTEVLMNEGKTLLCTRTEDTDMEMICSYMPEIPNQPPEFAWIPELDTPYPTVLAGRYGDGRVVYFANQTDKLCYTNGHEDFFDLFYGSLKWAAQGKFLVETDAPESVHVVVMEKVGRPEEKVVSIVNTTSGTERPVRHVALVADLYIKLILKAGSLEEYKILRKEGEVAISSEMGEEHLVVEARLAELHEFTSFYIRTKAADDK